MGNDLEMTALKIKSVLGIPNDLKSFLITPETQLLLVDEYLIISER